MSSLKSWWLKWFAFFSPVAGWEDRFRRYKSGQHVWGIPGKPDKPKAIPFPLEWIPHRLELTSEDDEAAHARGFAFESVTCVDTGQEAGIGVALSCLRCGVPLHPEAAHMFGGFDPPCCNRCRLVVKLLF